ATRRPDYHRDCGGGCRPRRRLPVGKHGVSQTVLLAFNYDLAVVILPAPHVFDTVAKHRVAFLACRADSIAWSIACERVVTPQASPKAGLADWCWDVLHDHFGSRIVRIGLMLLHRQTDDL